MTGRILIPPGKVPKQLPAVTVTTIVPSPQCAVQHLPVPLLLLSTEIRAPFPSSLPTLANNIPGRTYLTACVIFATLLRRSPVGLPATLHHPSQAAAASGGGGGGGKALCGPRVLIGAPGRAEGVWARALVSLRLRLDSERGAQARRESESLLRALLKALACLSMVAVGSDRRRLRLPAPASAG